MLILIFYWELTYLNLIKNKIKPIIYKYVSNESNRPIN